MLKESWKKFMEKFEPKVSIIIPIYNVEKYLEQCLNSVINQTYRNLQIILIDDGSTDNSGAICDKYMKTDKRIQVIHKVNGGSSSSREVGVNAANGQYLMFVDSDDWLDLEAIEKCMKIVQKDPDVSCVMFSYAKETETATVPMHIMDGDMLFIGDEVKDKIHRRLFGLSSLELSHPERMENIVSCCEKLYRIDLAKQGKYFDTKDVGSCEDGLFNIYALANCKKAAYIDMPLYHYRKRKGSLVKSYKPNFVEQWNTLFSLMQAYISENKLGQSYKEALNNRIGLSIMAISLNKLRDMNSSSLDKIRYIRSYLNTAYYKEAIQNMDMTNLPLTWKIMLNCCKMQMALVVYIAMLLISRKIGEKTT